MRKFAIAIMALVMVSQTANAEVLGTSLAAYWSYLDSEDISAANGGGARLKFTMTEIIGIEGRAAYMKFDEGDLTMVPAEAALTLNIPIGPLRAFGGVGIGYYFFDTDAADVQDQVGYFPLVGAEFDFGEDFFVYGEARWLFLSADADAVVEELEGVVEGETADFDGLGVQLGLGLRF